jgi:hypothetical protein
MVQNEDASYGRVQTIGAMVELRQTLALPLGCRCPSPPGLEGGGLTGSGRLLRTPDGV